MCCWCFSVLSSLLIWFCPLAVNYFGGVRAGSAVAEPERGEVSAPIVSPPARRRPLGPVIREPAEVPAQRVEEVPDPSDPHGKRPASGEGVGRARQRRRLLNNDSSDEDGPVFVPMPASPGVAGGEASGVQGEASPSVAPIMGVEGDTMGSPLVGSPGVCGQGEASVDPQFVPVPSSVPLRGLFDRSGSSSANAGENAGGERRYGRRAFPPNWLEDRFDPFLFLATSYTDEARERRNELIGEGPSRDLLRDGLCYIFEGARFIHAAGGWRAELARLNNEVLREKNAAVEALRESERRREEMDGEMAQLGRDLAHFREIIGKSEEAHRLERVAFEEEKAKINDEKEAALSGKASAEAKCEELSRKLGEVEGRLTDALKSHEDELARQKLAQAENERKITEELMAKIDAIAEEGNKKLEETQNKLVWEVINVYARGFDNALSQLLHLNPGGLNTVGLDPSKAVVDGEIREKDTIDPYPPIPVGFEGAKYIVPDPEPEPTPEPRPEHSLSVEDYVAEGNVEGARGDDALRAGGVGEGEESPPAVVVD